MKKIILDTDILNEMDDQFALAYLLGKVKNSAEYELTAITLAPFDPSKYLKINDKAVAMELSKKEVLKIFEMTNFSCPIYFGSLKVTRECQDNETIEAVDKIIEIANSSNEKVTILSIGCITNVALAIKKCPDIAKNLEVVWLGGNGLGFVDNDEFNLFQDKEAVNIVLKSDAEVTIIPARPISSALIMSKEVSREYILPLGELGQYLHNLIVTFSKDRKGAGRRLWDTACVFELFNRKKAKEILKTENFRAPIVYKTLTGVEVASDNCYFDNGTEKKTDFVCYLDAEVVIDDIITTLQKDKGELK